MKYLYINIIVLAGLLLGCTSSIHSQITKKASYGNFIIKNATIVTVTKGTFEGSVTIQDGIISGVSKSGSKDKTVMEGGATIIDAKGMYVYPGMIDGGTHIGLGEIGAVSLTQDYNELGDFIPHMQALTAVNPSSVNIPVNRIAGVTTALACPDGGLFPGTAALIHLHGYTPEQMFAGFKAPILNFPASGKRGRWDRRSEEDVKKDEEKANKKLNDIWTKAKQYTKIDSLATAKNKKKAGFNPQMDALMPVIRNEMPLLIVVNKDSDIKAAIKWVETQNVKAIFMGVAEGWRVAEEIAKAEIPVIVGPVLDNPRRASDPYEINYANPGILAKAGVQVAIRTNETENVRNLPYNAGFAATYGMGIDEALKAITINPAQIFGLGDKLGSIEKGKIANLIICTGDPFETKTDVKHVFINGWNIPMESRQTLLYDEFLDRSPGMNK